MADNSNTHATLPADAVAQLLAQRQAFETAVILRAWSDPAFADALRQDPVAAINATFGLELPAEFDVQLHHETPSTLHLVLPLRPIHAAADAELSEDDLERVAGGGFGGVALSASLAVTASGAIATAVSASAATVATAVVEKVNFIKSFE